MTPRPAAAPLRVARIDTVHGIRGEVSAEVLTDFPERFSSLRQVRIGRTAEGPLRSLQGWRLHRGKVLLKLEGIDSRGAAEGLVGSDVWVDASEAMPLPAETYYHRDLLGLQVEDLEGRSLGSVEDILRTGGTDVLVVRGGGGEVLIPAARSICVAVDLEEGRLRVDLPEGLLELNAD